MYICLSSGKFSDISQDFVDAVLVPVVRSLDSTPILLIGNALDGTTNSIIQMQMLKKTTTFLESLGLRVEQLDLTDYFEREHLLEDKLVHASGVCFEDGNPFVLHEALVKSGMSRILKAYLQRKSPFLCLGTGAGAAVLGSSLSGFAHAYNSAVELQHYTAQPTETGLGLLNYMCIPHFRSDHKTSQSMNLVLEHAVANKILCKALRDGEAILETTT